MTVSEAIESALQHHRAGRLAEAESIYRQVLSVCPDEQNCLHLLGVIAYSRGQRDDAARLISRAIAVNPEGADFHNNLALVWIAQGKYEEAAAACRRALELKPDSPEMYNNLGNALRLQGRLEEAIVTYRTALRYRPEFADVHNNLGVALKNFGSLEEAIAAFRMALQFNPDLAETYVNMGTALKELGKTDEAVAAYQSALQLKPDLAEAHNNLGMVLAERGQLDAAIAKYRLALQLRPDYADACNNLGLAFRGQGLSAAAVDAFRKAIQLNPDYLEAHSNLGVALKDQWQLDASVAAFETALRVKPDSAAAYTNLANVLKDQGRTEQAIRAFREATRLVPEEAVFLSNVIFGLQLREEIDEPLIRHEQAEWNRRFVVPFQPSWRRHRHDPDPERLLRIGYVSADFRNHAISYFIAPVIEGHDRREFQVHCYASVEQSDDVTQLLRKGADVWHDVARLSDAELAERVRDDGIDILVDLAMHTAGNRLLVFARKPAPVQISWLAHAGSVGVEAIDARLSDRWIEPVDPHGTFSVERVIRLPDSWCCYAPLGDFPDVSPLPALRGVEAAVPAAWCGNFPAVGPVPAMGRSTVTFGSLNQFGKVKGATLRCWSELLRRVPNSRLIMVCPWGQTAERTLGAFAARGIAADRLQLFSFGPWAEYVRLFQEIDVALDSFPFNGMTTTCHTLWMGVPVVTLAGTHPLSRTGLSLLQAVQLPELVATSEEEYVEIAARLAGDLPRLSKMRAELRTQMAASPLMNAPRFVRNLEEAFRALWKQWCAGGGG